MKPREERRPSVMDLANQANVSQTVNGWKIFHLTAQMEDLVIKQNVVRSLLIFIIRFVFVGSVTSNLRCIVNSLQCYNAWKRTIKVLMSIE